MELTTYKKRVIRLVVAFDNFLDVNLPLCIISTADYVIRLFF